MRRLLASVAVGALAWLGACSASSKAGVTVPVEAEAPRVRTFETNTGVHVVLSRAWLNIGAVELFGCTSAWHWLDVFSVPRAQAHVVGSPTRLGTPLVESLVGDDGSRTKMGELHPPEGSYCRVKQTILAADADAPGSPPDGAMLGKSVLVDGTYASEGLEPRPFHLSSTASFDVETTFEATALSLEARRAATIVLYFEKTSWFDGVAFEGDETDAITRILENLRTSLGARIE